MKIVDRNNSWGEFWNQHKWFWTHTKKDYLILEQTHRQAFHRWVNTETYTSSNVMSLDVTGWYGQKTAWWTPYSETSTNWNNTNCVSCRNRNKVPAFYFSNVCVWHSEIIFTASLLIVRKIWIFGHFENFESFRRFRFDNIFSIELYVGDTSIIFGEMWLVEFVSAVQVQLLEYGHITSSLLTSAWALQMKNDLKIWPKISR